MTREPSLSNTLISNVALQLLDILTSSRLSVWPCNTVMSSQVLSKQLGNVVGKNRTWMKERGREGGERGREGERESNKVRERKRVDKCVAQAIVSWRDPDASSETKEWFGAQETLTRLWYNNITKMEITICGQLALTTTHYIKHIWLWKLYSRRHILTMARGPDYNQNPTYHLPIPTNFPHDSAYTKALLGIILAREHHSGSSLVLGFAKCYDPATPTIRQSPDQHGHSEP